MAERSISSVKMRLTREIGGLRGWYGRVRDRWWFRILAILALLSGVFVFLVWLFIARNLPSVDALRTYEPPLPTNVRSIEGLPIHSYARERRVQLSFPEYPTQLVEAFLSAEDKTFFSHHGVDYPGMIGAVIDYATKMGTGQRARGGSTITQQVAKNLLIGSEYSPTRKIKEAILAWRIESTLSKEQILELYLNSIELGRNAGGVAAAMEVLKGHEASPMLKAVVA